MSKKIVFARVVLAAVLGASLVSGASAQTESQVLSKKVVYADLDLTKASDATTLLYRIRRAAESVCSGSATGAASPVLHTSRAYRACIQHATDRAVARLDNPWVTAAYTGGAPTEVAQK